MAIDPFFTSEELNQLARDSGFVQRVGKMDGSLFFDLIVFHSEDLKSQSDLSISLKERHAIEIKKQSLHERFNNFALIFLKEALEKMLQKQLDRTTVPAGFCKFNRILIKDSTCFQIDESLAQYYPGSGGGGSKASVRIQFEYDILLGAINDLSVNAFNEQDAKDSLATIELTKEGDLIIRDLAYMGIGVLKRIEDRNGYYLCRTNPVTNVLEKVDGCFKKIDFTELTKYMKKNGIDCLDKDVCLGSKEKFETRLIVYLLPEVEYARRIRRAEQNSQKKGKGPLSKQYKARGALNLFVTNAEQQVIPASKAWAFYRLRWQIELIFKIWKSICRIEKVKKVKKHRLECYIYSKLVLIFLGWKILWRTARLLLVRDGKALSLLKASKTLLQQKIGELRDIFMLGKGSVDRFLERFYDLSRTNHVLEKRLKQPSSLELLLGCLNFEELWANPNK